MPIHEGHTCNAENSKKNDNTSKSIKLDRINTALSKIKRIKKLAAMNQVKPSLTKQFLLQAKSHFNRIQSPIEREKKQNQQEKKGEKYETQSFHHPSKRQRNSSIQSFHSAYASDRTN